MTSPGFQVRTSARVTVLRSTRRALRDVVGELGPCFEGWWVEHDGAAAVEVEVRVASGGAVGDHGDGEVGGVGGVVEDLDVEDGGEAAEALGSDAEVVDLVVEFDAEFFDVGLGAALDELLHVDGVHEGLLGEEHGLFGGASDADAEHAGGAPAGAHGGDGFEDPVDDGVGWVEHGEFGFGFGATAFSCDDDVYVVAFDEGDFDYAGGVVEGVLAGEGGVGEDAAAEFVVGVEVGAAYAFVAHGLEVESCGAAVGAFPADVHADFEEDGDDAGVLADRAVALGAHARVDEDLGHGVFGGGGGFELVGAGEVGDVVDGVVVADVLEGVGYGLDQVVLFDGCHGSVRKEVAAFSLNLMECGLC